MRTRAKGRLATAFLGVCCLLGSGLVLAVGGTGGFRPAERSIVGLPFFDEAVQPASAMLPGVFTYQQQRSPSCEYASLHIATSLLGNPVSEYAFDEVVPRDENPHRGYRGDIHGEWGNTDDYGVYAAPLARALESFGFTGNAFYGGRAELEAELAAGRPVVVWLGMRGDAGSFDAYAADGTRFQLTSWMHVMVAYGFDAGGVFLTDPGTAMLRAYDWDTFLAMWNVMDGMALAVATTA